ncbi:IclR family transcriptional regulator [Pseudoroseomonas wenyumeiae]|uniref:IclR family transcriptional regulator n=1 Tax=Teichococcus wenyumeiae TaxID=2478470 RepID=A0A3A9J8A3_9PROT|nr:IclR family transcriptional regulator [Pseudoroseomonas wenyumeiae]RKK02230.1 IclR family transcriptional regulator [Pseudoroseomonas wenyumeiae]RMI15281.1 IclR family transcriptional regulator [Pseudoroseomonas wenyumeiae]
MRKRQSAASEPTSGLEEDEEDRQFIQVLARAMDILRAFTAEDSVLGNQELAERTGLPKATVSRLTYTMTKLGQLSYLPRFAKYQLGLGLVPLGQLALDNLAIRQVAAPLMRHLAEETNASVSLGSRDGLSMLYIEHFSPRTAVALQLRIGSRVPLGLTAMGRAYYAVATDAERAALDARFALAEPERWPMIQQGLQEAREMHAALGFTISVGDWNRTVHAAGAAFALSTGGIVAVNCGAPAFMLSRERILQEIGPRLAAVTQRIETLAGLRH